MVGSGVEVGSGVAVGAGVSLGAVVAVGSGVTSGSSPYPGTAGTLMVRMPFSYQCWLFLECGTTARVVTSLLAGISKVYV